MKVTVVIATMMVAQVSASFLEVFQGAVLSVQNSFGKLFSDVVTDVKDTVDCTILAVEHILSLSEDATARYYKKCASARNNTQSDSQLKNNFPVLEISIPNNEEYLKKELPEEIDARINATLLKILNGYNPHDKLKDVQKELAKETERLADVSDLVRQELDKLSKEIHLDFTNVERKGYKPSLDSILDKLKVLEAIEQNIRNSSEANEIHRLVDDVLNKLHVIESSGAKQNEKVDGILRDLERSSNRSYKDMRQQLEDWKAEEARHLNVIKAKMDDHEKLPKHIEYAKMDNTFSFIERPKISLVPIEKEIASKTVPLSSKNPVESIPSNIVTNTNSKFLTLITEQISSTSKIAIQPSLDATSPVQINDASGVITPVSISSSSYVNEINDDVMETLIPQKFKEPIFDPMPDTTLDFTTPITITEKTLEPNTSPPKETTERNRSVQKAIPKTSTYISTSISEARGSSYTNLGNYLNHLATTLMPTLDLFKNSLEPIRNPTTIQLENATSSSLMTSETNTIEEQKPEETTIAPETITEPNAKPKATTYVSVMSSQPTLSAMTSESPTSLLVTSTDPTKSSTRIPEPTTSILMTFPELTIFASTQKPTRSLAKPSIESNTNAATPLESTKSLTVTVLKPMIHMTSTKHDINPIMPAEPTRGLTVTTTDPATSSAVNPEPTMVLLVTTLESTKNPATYPELSTELQVTVGGGTGNFLVMPKSTTNIPVVAKADTTSPAMTQDPNMSLPVTASRLISFAMTSEPTMNLPMASTESTTNLTTTIELAMDLPLKAPESNLGVIWALTTELSGIASESTASPTKTSKPIPNMLMITSDATTRTTVTPDQTTGLPVMTSELKSSETIPEPTTNYSVTTLEPIISSEMIPELTTPGTTREIITYNLVKTTGIRTSAHVTNKESTRTSSPPKIMQKATTSLIAPVREPTNSIAPNLLVLNTNLSVSAFKSNINSTITPEPTTHQVKSSSSPQAMSSEPSMTSTVTITEPTPTSIMRTLGPTTISQMKVQEPITKPATILRETTTSRSIITTTNSIETMSKPTTGSLRTTLKLFTNNLSSFQHPFNLPTHRPGVPTPSLNAFLNYIDRKEGFTKPIKQSIGMTTNPVATPIGAEVKILPLSQSLYSKPLKNGPINAKLNAFFSHLPAQNISSPNARSDYAVPMNRTVLGAVLGLTPPKIAHNIPLPYIVKPLIAPNKNDHPRPLSFRHLRPQRPLDESSYGGNNNTPLGKGMPQKRHILPQRRNDQNTPMKPSVTLSTNLSSSLGLTTNKPVPIPKANNDDDADYKSFFHLSSKDSEAHSRALKEAKKLMEDSKRAHRIINSLLKKKNKGISAFNFPKSLNIGK